MGFQPVSGPWPRGAVTDDDVATVKRKIMTAATTPFEVDGATVAVEASVGISRCPQDGKDAKVLLRLADKGMYDVKKRARTEGDASGADTTTADGSIG